MIEINGVSYDKDELAAYIKNAEKYKTGVEYLEFKHKKEHKIIQALKEEYDATVSLNQEGDPFMLTRPQYEDILKKILEAGNG